MVPGHRKTGRTWAGCPGRGSRKRGQAGARPNWGAGLVRRSEASDWRRAGAGVSRQGTDSSLICAVGCDGDPGADLGQGDAVV